MLQLASEKDWRLRELLVEAERSQLKPEDAARQLYMLWDEGKLRMEDPRPPTSLLEYMKSVHGVWFLGILALVACSFLLIYSLPPYEMLLYTRYLVGSILILYAPGYVLVEALYFRKGDLDDLERLVLSIGLSLALVPLISLVLSYSPWGVRLESVFVAISSFTLLMGVVVASRRFNQIRGGPQS